MLSMSAQTVDLFDFALRCLQKGPALFQFAKIYSLYKIKAAELIHSHY